MKKIILQHPYILFFGILQVFFSAPGQTFLLSFFFVHIRETMEIPESLCAGLYSAATFAAALFLSPAGRLIDKYPIKRIILAVTIFMAVGCWILAASRNVLMVFIAFFILRLIGQGVFSLAGSTLIIKNFQKNRGKALGITTLGFPFSEMIYPSIALFLVTTFGWRTSYVLFGFSCLLLMLPIQWTLLTKAKLKRGHFLPGEEAINPQRMPGQPEERHIRPHKDFALGEVLHDLKFYLLLFAGCVPPMVVTGLFYHQITLFNANGWPVTLAVGGFALYAVFKAAGSVGIGPIVDRYGPLVPFVVIILLLASGTFLAGFGGPTHIVYYYFCIIGAALGFTSPVMNVVWPHFYGVKHMGSIKGFIATFRNGLTGLGPLPIALALDSGFSINQVLIWTSYAIFLTALLPLLVWRMDNKN